MNVSRRQPKIHGLPPADNVHCEIAVLLNQGDSPSMEKYYAMA